MMKTYDKIDGKIVIREGGRFTLSPRRTGHILLARAHTAYGQAKANEDKVGMEEALSFISFLKTVKPNRPEEE